MAAAPASPAVAAVNTADAGLQIAIVRPRELPRNHRLYGSDGATLGQVVKATAGPAGYVDRLQVRDRHGVVREVSAIDAYVRRKRIVTDMSRAEFAASPLK